MFLNFSLFLYSLIFFNIQSSYTVFFSTFNFKFNTICCIVSKIQKKLILVAAWKIWKKNKRNHFFGKISSNCFFWGRSQAIVPVNWYKTQATISVFGIQQKKTALNWHSNQFGTKNLLTSNVLNFISFIYLFISILHLASIFSMLFLLFWMINKHITSCDITVAWQKLSNIHLKDISVSENKRSKQKQHW